MENPHGPPRAGPAPAARPRGVFAGAQDPPGTRSGTWSGQRALPGGVCVGEGTAAAGRAKGRGRHRGGSQPFLLRPDLTSRRVARAVARWACGLPGPLPKPQPRILPLSTSGLERGDFCTPGPSVAPAPPPWFSAGWPGSLAALAAAPSRPEASGVGVGVWQDSPRPAVSPPPAGARATRGLPSPRPGTEGREQRDRAPVAQGSVPGLAGN